MPSATRQPGAFYGWRVLVACTIARGFTAPGQTIGVSAFTDDLISSLGVSRSAVATAYMVGTLTGATALPFIGRWVDRAGVRRTMTVIGSLFAIAVMLTGTVQNVVMLAVAFVGLRMLGQGSLFLIGTTGINLWFEERRGFALAISGMGSIAMLAMAPILFRAIISAVGWRMTWLILGIAVAVVVVPIARFAIVDRPEHIGQQPDGPFDGDGATTVVRGRSYTVAEALRTPAFWTLSGLTLTAGAVVTGVTFHNTDLLGEQGLTAAQASAIFIPQMVGSVAANFAVGWMTDRFPSRPLMFFAGTALATGIALATVATPGAMSLLYGFVVGVAGGSTAAISAALMPKWFGVDHIGAIKGVAQTAGVAASAVGPLILSIGNDAADSYGPVVLGCAAVALLMAVIAAVVPTP